jgi:hypothetical protein
MIDQEQLQILVTKWTTDNGEYRAEAHRLELNDRDRHATSIATLEARAEAIDRCIIELRRVSKL